MSKLLLDEYPLVILPTLAVKIGLNEAIALQQLHYWIKTSPHLINGVPWYYNSAESWRKDFPFWSRPTIQRAFDSLEKQGLIKKGNFNKLKFDRTLWFTIDYEAVASVESREQSIAQDEQRDSQNEQPSTQDVPTIPETSSETSSESIDNIIPAPPEISQPEIEQAQNEARGVTNPELAAVIGDIEERTGQLKPAQLKHIVELWEEFPYLDAHAHAYEATKKADFFNLNYYETCLVSFVAQHTEAKNGTHRTDSTEAKRERSRAAGARGNGRARGARSDISSPARW